MLKQSAIEVENKGQNKKIKNKVNTKPFVDGHKKINVKEIKKKSQQLKQNRLFLYSIDQKFLHDPKKVGWYAQNIFEFYKDVEKKRLIQMNWIKNTKYTHRRIKIIDYFILWSYFFKFKQETLYLSIFILDQFLFKTEVSVEEMSKIFVSCILLATKFEEIKFYAIFDFLEHIKQNISKEDIIVMESRILQSLQYNLSYYSPVDFLKRLCFIEEQPEDVYERCCFILEHFLYNPNVNCFPQSEITIACYFLVFELLGKKVETKRLHKYFPFNKQNINSLKKVIERTFKEILAMGIETIKDKYQDKLFVKEYILKVKNVFQIIQ